MDEGLQRVGAGSPVSDVQVGDAASRFPFLKSLYDPPSPVPPTEEQKEGDFNGTTDLQSVGAGSPVSTVQVGDTAIPFPYRVSHDDMPPAFDFPESCAPLSLVLFLLKCLSLIHLQSWNQWTL